MERQVATPHVDHRAQVSLDAEVDGVPRVLRAQLGASLLDEDPPGPPSRGGVPDGELREESALRWELVEIEAPPDVPHEKPWVELVVGQLVDDAEYKGQDMASAHKHLKITSSDFLAAGGDVKQVMAEMGYGENEIQEVVCALTAFVPVVVVQN